MAMINILTRASVPPELAHAWLQHLRDFDTAHPGCHYEVLVDDPNKTPLAEVMKILAVHPPMPVMGVLKREEE